MALDAAPHNAQIADDAGVPVLLQLQKRLFHFGRDPVAGQRLLRHADEVGDLGDQQIGGIAVSLVVLGRGVGGEQVGFGGIHGGGSFIWAGAARAAGGGWGGMGKRDGFGTKQLPLL